MRGARGGVRLSVMDQHDAYYARLFKHDPGRHGLRAVRHDRVYDDLPRMSLLHRLAASARVTARLDALGLGWLGKALRHLAAVYQVWWFEKLTPREGATPDRPAA